MLQAALAIAEGGLLMDDGSSLRANQSRDLEAIAKLSAMA